MKAKKGFTLVEILIVVVILGILAAIVIPQFSQASTDSKVSSLKSNLQTIRSQIALYKIQHNDETPALATFEAQMTEFSDIDGNTNGAVKTDVFCYGPYLQVGIPANPFVGGNPPTVVAVDAGPGLADWVYETDGTTWNFYANSDTSPDTADHVQY